MGVELGVGYILGAEKSYCSFWLEVYLNCFGVLGCS